GDSGNYPKLPRKPSIWNVLSRSTQSGSWILRPESLRGWFFRASGSCTPITPISNLKFEISHTQRGPSPQIFYPGKSRNILEYPTFFPNDPNSRAQRAL